MRELRVKRAAAFFLSLALLACASACATSGQARNTSGVELSGPWQSTAGSEYLNFADSRMISFGPKGLTVRRVVRRESATLILRHSGRLETWQVAEDPRVLRLTHDGESTEYRRLNRVPPEVTLDPPPLGSAAPLPPERIQSIQEEVAARNRREQAAIRDPAQAGQLSAMSADNTRFLVALIREVGWLDAARFGEKTSVLAVILAKHSRDLRLMMAVLPYAEKDLRLTGDGQTYAVLYDGLQIELGNKQRYGTQIAQDSEGKPYVLPMEEPGKVDDWLKEMGLPPFSKYLEDASKILYGGQPIRMARSDE